MSPLRVFCSLHITTALELAPSLKGHCVGVKLLYSCIVCIMVAFVSMFFAFSAFVHVTCSACFDIKSVLISVCWLKFTNSVLIQHDQFYLIKFSFQSICYIIKTRFEGLFCRCLWHCRFTSGKINKKSLHTTQILLFYDGCYLLVSVDWRWEGLWKTGWGYGGTSVKLNPSGRKPIRL